MPPSPLDTDSTLPLPNTENSALVWLPHGVRVEASLSGGRVPDALLGVLAVVRAVNCDDTRDGVCRRLRVRPWAVRGSLHEGTCAGGCGPCGEACALELPSARAGAEEELPTLCGGPAALARCSGC